MQQIWGPGQASNILLTAQKRLIRPAYAQTQGFPYACFMDPSWRNADGSVNFPINGSVLSGYTYSAATYTNQGSIIPGVVVTKTQNGESVIPHNGGNGQPFGLLAQWIGGTFDNLGQMSEISAWLGVDSTYELLAPAWNDTQVASLVAASGVGTPVPLFAQTDGRLGNNGTETVAGSYAQTGPQLVAWVMDRPTSARLVIKLAI
jgi:hypothetical protein